MRDRLAQVAYPPKPPGITLTIDNGDGAGLRDYAAAIDPESRVRLHRKLNAGAELELALRLRDPALLVPTAGARVRLSLADGTVLFTGRTVEAPAYEFLGWSDSGPVYRLAIRAEGDERALDERALPIARVFHDVSAGEALKQLTADIAGDELDCTNVAELDKVFGFTAERRRPWSEQAAALAAQARAMYRIEDGKLWLEAIGTRVHVVTESDTDFAPVALKVRSRAARAADVTVVGDSEPAAYVREYFVGDASRASFALSRRPLTHPQRTLLKDEFASLDPLKWRIADPASAIACDAGMLILSGGTGTAGETSMIAVGRLPLAGALVLQHGRIVVTGACDGIVGGLYPGAVTQDGCVAGFLFATSGTQTTISPLIDGASAGDPIAVADGHSYLLRTRLYCAEQTRTRQVWHSSQHPAEKPLGGEAVAAQLRIVLDIADADLSQPSQQPSWSILGERVLDAAPPFADYGLIGAASMHAQISQTRVWTAPEVELKITPAGEDPRTVMLGSQADGGVAVLAPGAVLRFFDQAVPPYDEQITVRYRTSRIASARVAAASASRVLVCKVAAPHPVSSQDCALAAEALLDDISPRRCAGEYTAWKTAADANIRPGDTVHLDVPSRELDLDAVVREVWLEPEDIAAVRWRARFRFANEAAEAIAITTAAAARDPEPQAAIEPGAQPTTIESLPAAEVYSIGSGSAVIDAGQEPPDGGGFEVRSEDANWGSDGAGLIGLFTTREFLLDRTSRPAEYYLRAFDGSAPPRHSDVSTIFHVDYPL